MSVSVRDIVGIPGLPLRLLAGEEEAGRPIRWVHVSELEDPTPWMKGGELILTTGLGIGETPAKQRAYLKRLVDAGLTGLGFGLGFTHELGDIVTIRADRLGALINRVVHTDKAPPWTFGATALMRNLAKRGLLA